MRASEIEAEKLAVMARAAAMVTGLDGAIECAEALVVQLRQRKEEVQKAAQATVERLLENDARVPLEKASSGTYRAPGLGNTAW